jgi:hypothetical protein
MIWDAGHQRFSTLRLPSATGDRELCLVMPALGRPGVTLALQRADIVEAQQDLDGISKAAALRWLDERLTEVGLKPASPVVLPYELPSEVADVDVFEITAQAAALASLAAWFDIGASTLAELDERHRRSIPGVGPIWVWPHHFDIASYIRLDGSSAESAPGIGVGLSPGDESYDQPYFYVNPWPRPALNDLPGAPAPGHWHTTGFIGAVATARELLATLDVSSSALAFANDAVATARKLL